MRYFLYLMLFSSKLCLAQSEANCHLISGIYQNSSNSLNDLKFTTIVDVFNLTNAKTLAMNLDGKNLRFVRSDLNVNKNTKMIFLLHKNGGAIRAAYVMIDRTPRQVSKSKEFYGNMIISDEMIAEETMRTLSSKNLYYNFYCSF